MRYSWLVVAAVVCTGAWLAAGAQSEEGAGGMPPPQKAIKDVPLAKALLGSWTVTSKGSMGDGTGTLTFALGVGETALLESYQNTFKQGEQLMPFHGHGVYKFSDDGKTCTCWWFDSRTAEPTKMTGPCDEKGFTLTGDSAQAPMGLKMTKLVDGFEARVSSGGNEFLVDTLKQAK